MFFFRVFRPTSLERVRQLAIPGIGLADFLQRTKALLGTSLVLFFLLFVFCSFVVLLKDPLGVFFKYVFQVVFGKSKLLSLSGVPLQMEQLGVFGVLYLRFSRGSKNVSHETASLPSTSLNPLLWTPQI